MRARCWPDPAAVRELLHSTAWLTFCYMLLLTLFELIELLRPKPARYRPAPPAPAGPSANSLCPTCASIAVRPRRRRCLIL